MPEAEPQIRTFTLGSFAVNCTLVIGPEPGRCWLADCGFEPAPILDEIRRLGLTPEAIVLTHAHCDHIAGLAEARRRLDPPPPVWLHEAEADWLGRPDLNLSAMLGPMIPGPEGRPIEAPAPDRLLRDGEVLALAGADWRVIHVPGHSPGGIGLHLPSALGGRGLLIGGDALFRGSIGRTDFPGSDHDTLVRSIRRALYTLPDSTAVLPGHGEPTTIGEEKRHNPHVRPADPGA